VGSAWAQFPVRFYIIALVFLLFEVEILFMFPWAVVFADGAAHTETAGRWGWFAFAEMVIFILVLAAGLAYAWRKGHLQWPKPLQASASTDSHIPQQFYDAVNERYKPAR
jgi:NADH-quinone oxidoreductase subunit A